jgi:hypothetical protein
MLGANGSLAATKLLHGDTRVAPPRGEGLSASTNGIDPHPGSGAT